MTVEQLSEEATDAASLYPRNFIPNKMTDCDSDSESNIDDYEWHECLWTFDVAESNFGHYMFRQPMWGLCHMCRTDNHPALIWVYGGRTAPLCPRCHAYYWDMSVSEQVRLRRIAEGEARQVVTFLS